MGPIVGDALGSALVAHLRDDDGWHVLERDDGHVEPMNAAVYFAEPGDWPEGEPAALDEVRGRVLDIGAGGGRYAVELQRRGHDVVALDVSPGAIEVCRQRGIDQVFTGTIFDLEDTGFDAFVLGGHNLGLLESPSHARTFLARLRRLSRPGARVVGTSRDPHDTSDPDHLVYHEVNRERGREPGQVRLRVRHRRLATDWFDYWFLSPEELKDLVEAEGWLLTVHESLAFGSYLAVLELSR